MPEVLRQLVFDLPPAEIGEGRQEPSRLENYRPEHRLLNPVELMGCIHRELPKYNTAGHFEMGQLSDLISASCRDEYGKNFDRYGGYFEDVEMAEVFT